MLFSQTLEASYFDIFLAAIKALDTKMVDRTV